MVLANNAITLNQLQANIVNNHASFNDIHQVSTSTLARILKKNIFKWSKFIKCLSSAILKGWNDYGMIMQRYVFTLAVWSCILSHNLLLYCNMYTRSTLNYTILPDTVLQGVLRMDGEEIQHEFIYIDEAGFNLTRTRRRGRNIIGHRAIVNVPGQRGGNITLCAAITQNGVLHRHAHMGPYNTALILTFLDQLHNITASNRSYAIHCCLGQCVFPMLCSGSELVLATSTFHRPISSTILSIPQPYRRVFLGMVVEGIWSPSPGWGTPHPSHGGGLWPDGGSSNARMDSSFKTFLVVLLMTTLPAMLMKFSGQIQLGEETMSSCVFFFLQ